MHLQMLDSLQVANFVLPAIPELLDTWTHAFGFRPLDASQRLQYRDLSMMVFPGTELLQKPLTRTLKADILPVGNQLLQQLDSSTNFLESDGQSAGGALYVSTLQICAFEIQLSHPSMCLGSLSGGFLRTL